MLVMLTLGLLVWFVYLDVCRFDIVSLDCGLDLLDVC